MKFFTSYADPEKTEGVWIDFPVKGKTYPAGKAPAFKIRRMPDGKARELQYGIQGRKSTIAFKNGGSEIANDAEKNVALRLAKAAWCLLDSRNIEHAVGDAAGLKEWRQALGISGDVPATAPDAPARFDISIGVDFSMDGHWTPAAKNLYLPDCEPIVAFLLKESDKLGVEVAEDEAGKGTAS